MILSACSRLNLVTVLPNLSRTMKRGRRRAGRSVPPFTLLMISSIAALPVSATASTAAAPFAPSSGAGGLEQAAFMSSPSGWGLVRQGRQRGGSGGSAAQAVRSRPGSTGRGGAGPDRRVAVDDESWYLGDGGFAARHLEDEERMAAKKVGFGGEGWGGVRGVGA